MKHEIIEPFLAETDTVKAKYRLTEKGERILPTAKEAMLAVTKLDKAIHNYNSLSAASPFGNKLLHQAPFST